MTLPVELYAAASVCKLEAGTIASGISGYALMQRAGTAALKTLRECWPQARAVAFVCGRGNNGGDGMVMARLAHGAGIEVRVLMVGSAEGLKGEAAEALRDLRAAGLNLEASTTQALTNADVIVDALLGLGVRAPLSDEAAKVISAINSSGRPVLAMDLPSGLDPDSGLALPAVRARATISFIALKQGLFMGDGPGYAGEIFFDALHAGSKIAPAVNPAMIRMTDADLGACLPRRPRSSHKGLFGRVLIVGGGTGMPGAVRLAAEAALRTGAGLVSVASLPEHQATVVGARPELMFRGIGDARELAKILQDFDVVAIGPGLGKTPWSRSVLKTLFASRPQGQGLVVDADALNLLAEGEGPQSCEDWILTPHPGEAARLLNSTTAVVQQDRSAALKSLCERRGGVVVLKGASTLVGKTGGIARVCERGNPGMAVAGMGDVLTGCIAGLLAQHGQAFAAAAAGVWLHATAGDLCAANGLRGVLALDVATRLRDVLAPYP
jgi:ADP-dependent NAD(P)H-hydrate dehydratase / NAD(P)H-hydrate epimerase